MKSKSQKSHEVRFSVPFYDLDPMQVVWHGNYLKYFDITRAGLFDNIGVDLYAFYEKTKYIFPIIKTSTKHIFPLKHRDEFICKASLADVSFKIIIDFEIRLVSGNRLCARGRSEQAAVKYPEMEILYRIPDEIREGLGF